MALHSSISNISTPANRGPIIGERTRAYLLPGELRVSTEPCQMITILGSCISICLWDAKLGIGGMNHFLLPAWREGSGPSSRFGDVATRALLQKLMEIGSQRQHLKAKLFGGAAILRSEDSYPTSLGAKNVAAAVLMMQNADIPVVAQDTGGHEGRKVIFNSDDGSAWSRQV